jgi:hypothetical protein
VSLKIRVLDENDERPKFPAPKILFPLSESTKIGTTVHRFQAADPDLGSNGRVKYLLGGGDNRNLVLLSDESFVILLSSFYALYPPLRL